MNEFLLQILLLSLGSCVVNYGASKLVEWIKSIPFKTYFAKAFMACLGYIVLIVYLDDEVNQTYKLDEKLRMFTNLLYKSTMGREYSEDKDNEERSEKLFRGISSPVNIDAQKTGVKIPTNVKTPKTDVNIDVQKTGVNPYEMKIPTNLTHDFVIPDDYDDVYKIVDDTKALFDEEKKLFRSYNVLVTQCRRPKKVLEIIKNIFSTYKHDNEGCYCCQLEDIDKCIKKFTDLPDYCGSNKLYKKIVYMIKYLHKRKIPLLIDATPQRLNNIDADQTDIQVSETSTEQPGMNKEVEATLNLKTVKDTQNSLNLKTKDAQIQLDVPKEVSMTDKVPLPNIAQDMSIKSPVVKIDNTYVYDKNPDYDKTSDLTQISPIDAANLNYTISKENEDFYNPNQFQKTKDTNPRYKELSYEDKAACDNINMKPIEFILLDKILGYQNDYLEDVSV